jgi:hypothetical protein
VIFIYQININIQINHYLLSAATFSAKTPESALVAASTLLYKSELSNEPSSLTSLTFYLIPPSIVETLSMKVAITSSNNAFSSTLLSTS